MSKFKLTQTATEVQNILNNSLQKPTGLSKTKLVGVGVNGQENIEIGDNLTLANGKLSASGGSQIHGYSIIVNNNFHYEVYTTKDYNLGIGQETTIEQFFANNDYAELHKAGCYYPAAGYYRKSFDGSDMIVNLFHISNGGSYYVEGYNITNSKYESASITPGFSPADVIKLF